MTTGITVMNVITAVTVITLLDKSWHQGLSGKMNMIWGLITNMGWSMKTNNVDEWNVTSSVTDEVISKFESEQDLKRWLAYEKIYQGKRQAVELLMTFPNQWNVNGKIQRNPDKCKEYNETYFDWLKSIEDSETYEEYYKNIDEKLEELLR